MKTSYIWATMLAFLLSACPGEDSSDSLAVLVTLSEGNIDFDTLQIRLESGGQTHLRTVADHSLSSNKAAEVARFLVSTKNGDKIFVTTLDGGQVLSEVSQDLSDAQQEVSLTVAPNCTLSSCMTECDTVADCMKRVSCGVVSCQDNKCQEILDDSLCENNGTCTSSGCVEPESFCGDGMVDSAAGEVCDTAEEAKCTTSGKQCYRCFRCTHYRLELNPAYSCSFTSTNMFEPDVVREFDPAGNLTLERRISNGVTTYERTSSWDGKHRKLDDKIDSDGDGSFETTQSWNYYENPRRENHQMVSPTEVIFDQTTYNEHEQLVSFVRERNATTIREEHYTYDSEGRRIRLRVTDHDAAISRTTTVWTYDGEKVLSQQRTADASGDELSRIDYEYDAEGRRTKIVTKKAGRISAERTLTYEGDITTDVLKQDRSGDGIFDRSETTARRNDRNISFSVDSDLDGNNDLHYEWTYDANGNQTSSRIDKDGDGEFDDIDIQTFGEANNLLTRRKEVDGVVTHDERAIWDEKFNLRSKTVQLNNSEPIEYTYFRDAYGRAHQIMVRTTTGDILQNIDYMCHYDRLGPGPM